MIRKIFLGIPTKHLIRSAIFIIVWGIMNGYFTIALSKTTAANIEKNEFFMAAVFFVGYIILWEIIEYICDFWFQISYVHMQNGSYRYYFRKLYFTRPEELIKGNSGYAAGNNIGLSLALHLGAEAFWILNNDTIVSANALDEMVNCLFQKQRPGLCGSLICYQHAPELVQCRAGGKTNKWTGLSCLNGSDLNVKEALAISKEQVSAHHKEYTEVCNKEYAYDKALMMLEVLAKLGNRILKDPDFRAEIDNEFKTEVYEKLRAVD